METQIATTIEQSKRLMEAGLSPDSADVYWREYWGMHSSEPIETVLVIDLHPELRLKSDIPAWSLSRLIDIRGGFKIWEIDNSAELIESLVKSIIILISYGDINKEYLKR